MDCSEETGYFFVDRDPRWCAVVLAYLWNRTVHRPRGRGASQGLKREAPVYAVLELLRQSQKCLLAITTVGCHPHVYEPNVGLWRQLCAPLHVDVDCRVETCVWWDRVLVAATCGADNHSF